MKTDPQREARFKKALTACDGNGWTHDLRCLDFRENGTVFAMWTAIDGGLGWDDHWKTFDNATAFDAWLADWETELVRKGLLDGTLPAHEDA